MNFMKLNEIFLMLFAILYLLLLSIYACMLRLNPMNYFALVWYYSLCCPAGESDKEVLHREPWKPMDDICYGMGHFHICCNQCVPTIFMSFVCLLSVKPRCYMIFFCICN